MRSEIEAEIEAHLELFVEEQVLAGTDPTQARSEAERRFGDRHQITRACMRVSDGNSTMNRSLFIGLGAFLLIGLALFITQFQIRQLQAKGGQVQPRMANTTAPVQPEQILARVGGTLTIVERGRTADEFCGNYTVQRDGMILLPETGWYYVAGKSRPELEKAISELASLYYPSAMQLDIIVSDPEPMRVATRMMNWVNE
ncbi:MAG: hypothetical protein GY930_03830 [bacterium]|nr:hypothetical protein [bacterium]